MKNLFKIMLRHLMRHSSGATATEYGLIAAAIAMTIMTAVFFFGETIQQTFISMFTTLSTYLQEG